jgi:hypothetical protein
MIYDSMTKTSIEKVLAYLPSLFTEYTIKKDKEDVNIYQEDYRGMIMIQVYTPGKYADSFRFTFTLDGEYVGACKPYKDSPPHEDCWIACD